MTENLVVITRDPEVMGGTPVFTGTRVPVQTLLDYLEEGEAMDAFLDDFPTVQKQQAQELIASLKVLLFKAA